MFSSGSQPLIWRFLAAPVEHQTTVVSISSSDLGRVEAEPSKIARFPRELGVGMGTDANVDCIEVSIQIHYLTDLERSMIRPLFRARRLQTGNLLLRTGRIGIIVSR